MKETMTRIYEEDLNLLDTIAKKLGYKTRTKTLHYILDRINTDLLNEEAYEAAMDDLSRELNNKNLEEVLDPRD